MAEQSMAAIVEALAAVYTDDGIAEWLDRRNRNLSGARPISRCWDRPGRARVLELAEQLQERMV